MPQQTITILRAGFIPTGAIRDEIDADVDGPFAIHETIPLTLGGYTLTHVPTGYAVLSNALRLPLMAARAELLASGLDWSFTDPKALTAEHRRVGKAPRKKYWHIDEAIRCDA